ncbi:hypothetical protein D6783_05385 [Candidatus Woesearchaeota archaeon]|nr:MAG: hypothetical protein D6783_05385 [Candidatus Woesearchaeota archaeon]
MSAVHKHAFRKKRKKKSGKRKNEALQKNKEKKKRKGKNTHKKPRVNYLFCNYYLCHYLKKKRR